MTEPELVAAAEATDNFNDTKAQNAAADCVAGIYRELRSRGLESQQALLPLLDHPSIKVRGWAGAHALEFAPDIGEEALNKIAAGDVSLHEFEAKITLREWRAGRLRFP